MIKMANLLDFNLGGIQVMDIKKIIEWRKKKTKRQMGHSLGR